MTAPLGVDAAALEAAARELAALSDHSGRAVAEVTAAANLLVFAEGVAASARWYRSTDTQAAGALAQAMRPR